MNNNDSIKELEHNILSAKRLYLDQANIDFSDQYWVDHPMIFVEGYAADKLERIIKLHIKNVLSVLPTDDDELGA